MKKLFYLLLIFIFKSANAANGMEIVPVLLPPGIASNQLVNEYAQRFLNDEKFTNVMEVFVKNSWEVRKHIVAACGEEGYNKYESLAAENDDEAIRSFYESNHIDTGFICDKHSDNLFEWGRFINYEYPDFNALSEEEQISVFEKMKEIFTDDFVNKYPANPFVNWLIQLLESRSGDLLVAYQTKGGPNTLEFIYNKLSAAEVGKCLLGAGVSFLAGNYKALRTIAGLLDGEWSFAGIREVISMFIPEAKIASVIIGFAGCIITAAIW
jgi:hypothetical protein